MDLNQVIVSITNIDKAIEFYQKLGQKLIVKAEHILQLSADEVLCRGGRKVKVEGPLLEEGATDF